jgi:hypothetical protein
MKKKKQISSPWSNKKIDEKLLFGSVLIFLLIYAFAVYAYTSPILNTSAFSVQDYFRTMYWNWKNSLLSQPVESSRPVKLTIFTPTLFPSEVNSSTISEVKVSRSISSFVRANSVGANSPFIPLGEITDHATAQVLYDTIVALPPYPTPVSGRPLSASCAFNAKNVLYDLSFLSFDNKPIHHAVVSMTECGGYWWVTLDGSYKREFYSDIHLYVPFRSLLESSLGLTSSQLDGQE